MCLFIDAYYYHSAPSAFDRFFSLCKSAGDASQVAEFSALLEANPVFLVLVHPRSQLTPLHECCLHDNTLMANILLHAAFKRRMEHFVCNIRSSLDPCWTPLLLSCLVLSPIPSFTKCQRHMKLHGSPIS